MEIVKNHQKVKSGRLNFVCKNVKYTYNIGFLAKIKSEESKIILLVQKITHV